MDALEVTIGKKIRLKRQELKLTIQELADRSGISRAMLSKIELGKVSTPISTYSRIVKNLEMPLVWLFGSREADFLLIRKDDPKPLSTRNPVVGYRYEILGDTWSDKSWSAYILTYAPETALKRPHFIHDSNEFVYVLEGQIQFHYQDVEYVLSEGDCLFLDGSKPHGGRAYGGKGCKVLLILTPRT